jgi:hypothetical protein
MGMVTAKYLSAKAWAVVEWPSMRLLVVDARFPVFWSRRVARDFAAERGYETYGSKADAKVIRVGLVDGK